MEAGKIAAKPCCPSGEPCKVPTDKSYCKCEPGWNCVVTKIDPNCCKPSYVCNEDDGCVCITSEESQPKLAVQTPAGAYCECSEGYTCTVTKVGGPANFECCNGCKCEVPSYAS